MKTLLSRIDASQKLSPVIVNKVPPNIDPYVGLTELILMTYSKALAVDVAGIEEPTPSKATRTK